MNNIKNKKLLEQMQGMGFRFSQIEAKTKHDRAWTISESTLSACLEYSALAAKGNPMVDRETNKNMSTQVMGTSGGGMSDNWCGGSGSKLAKDLAGGMNMKPFLEEKDRLSKSDLMKKIQDKIRMCSPKRKRSMDSHDGEWIMDRQWEIEPFAKTARRMTAARSIEMLVNFTFHAGTDTETLEKYGCMVWALSDILESNGITVGITVQYTSQNNNGENYQYDIKLKKSGEYISPLTLAVAHQAVVFRRHCFAVWTGMADVIGADVSKGMGRGYSDSTAIQFADGALKITPDYMRSSSETIEAALLQALAA